MDVVLPRVEKLQTYIWRRHLASAANRLLAQAADEGPGTTSTMAVGFVDIVGYTGQSKTLTDAELVEWVEYFEDEMTRTVVDLGGRVIKTIGDEVLFVADDPVAAAEVALIATERGADDDDRFPRVRAGRRVRRGGQPARRRLRPDGQHRRPADVGGPAGHGAGRPRRLRGAVRADRRGPVETTELPGRRRVAAGCRRSSTGPPTSWPSCRRTPRPASTASAGCRAGR